MSDETPEPAQTNSILVVDPDIKSRNASEDLEDDLDRQVIAMDSFEFDTEASEEVLGAAVYIISWDLDIRSGADLLEEIRSNERLAMKTVLVATEAPTANLVRCAMQLGADGICLKPYDPEQIKSLLDRFEAKDESQAA